MGREGRRGGRGGMTGNLSGAVNETWFPHPLNPNLKEKKKKNRLQIFFKIPYQQRFKG
jgi:hypothetical protein